MTNSFRGERIWRTVTNFWTIVLLVFLAVNFFYQDRFDFLTSTLSIIYTGVLTLYAGTKEFDRWYSTHESLHPGEWFIIIWTIFLFATVSFWAFLGSSYKIPPEVIADYIMVLTIFALTQKSKRLYVERKTTRQRTAK